MALARPPEMGVRPTGRERFFDPEEVIVSKTDCSGRITYANDVFVRVSGYTEKELLGQPHSIIRHPEMPRAVFRMLWDTIEQGREIFAYVVNMAKTGDHYWVFAHVTPTFGASGEIVGFHSNRRVPEPKPLETIQSIYRSMLQEERRQQDKAAQIEASSRLLTKMLADRNCAYDELMFTL